MARHKKTWRIIETAIEILTEFRPMTVRQVYYQLVSRQAAKIDIERLAGRLLAGIEKAKGAARPKETRSHDVTALADMGITKMQSSRWQQAASVPEEDVKALKAKATDDAKELTSASVLKRAKVLLERLKSEVESRLDLDALAKTRKLEDSERLKLGLAIEKMSA